jgi:uncharacterized protein YbcI
MSSSDASTDDVFGDGAPTSLPAGSRSLEVSNTVARLHKQYVGRGPANVRTTIDGDLVVVLLEGGYTQAEQTLDENDRSDLVAAGRVGLQEAMRHALVQSVQAVLDREVVSFMSANDLAGRLSVEVFVLAPDDAGGDVGLPPGSDASFT